MPKKKHVPPAKIKYDKTHPVISIRIDQDLKKELMELKEKSDKSVGDILREAIGVQKKSTKQAYNLGFTKARHTYLVLYKCSVCGKPIIVDTYAQREAAALYMREHGWKHVKCVG